MSDEDDWLVVEPTHLKNMRKSNWIISPSRDENKKYLSCHHLDDDEDEDNHRII